MSDMNVKSPTETLIAANAAGMAKASATRNYGRLAIMSALAGCYIAFGGVLSLIIGYGFPEITANNPALQKTVVGMRVPNRTHPRRGTRRGAFHRQQCTAYAPLHFRAHAHGARSYSIGLSCGWAT